jgi:Spy/CpxP family protein refolding chaperone
MKRQLIKIATVAALAAGMAFAQAAAAPSKPGRAGIKLGAAVRQRILANLNLTDAQKAQAKEIMQQARTAAQPVRQQLQQSRQSLAAAVKNDDTVQIQSLAAAQGALQGQVLAIQSTAKAKLFAILTPEQKAKAEQTQQKIKQLRQQIKALRANG